MATEASMEDRVPPLQQSAIERTAEERAGQESRLVQLLPSLNRKLTHNIASTGNSDGDRARRPYSAHRAAV